MAGVGLVRSDELHLVVVLSAQVGLDAILGPRRVDGIDVVGRVERRPLLEDAGREILRAGGPALVGRHGLHAQGLARRQIDEVVLHDELAKRVERARVRGDQIVGLGVVFRELVLHLRDDLRVVGGHRLPGPQLGVQLARGVGEDHARLLEVDLGSPHRLVGRARGLERQRELLVVERRTEPPVAVGLGQKVLLEEALVGVERGHRDLERGATLRLAADEGLHLAVHELDAPAVRLHRLLDVDLGRPAPARGRAAAIGLTEPGLGLAQEEGQRLELGDHAGPSLRLDLRVGVDEVGHAVGDDLAWVVVRERVVEARVPGVVADLVEVEQLEPRAGNEDGEVDVVVGREGATVRAQRVGAREHRLERRAATAERLLGQVHQAIIETVITHEAREVRASGEQPIDVLVAERFNLGVAHGRLGRGRRRLGQHAERDHEEGSHEPDTTPASLDDHSRSSL